MNAKDEFLKNTIGLKIIAAKIDLEEDSFKLKPGYKTKDYEDFLNFLDREYDDGYGGQNLHGIIYCEDGYWLERGEYDGSEWWNLLKYPKLDENFDKIDILKYERSKKLNHISSSL